MAYTRFLLLVLLHQTGGVLEVNVPSSHQARMGSETLIPCMFTVDKPHVNPKFLVVSWYFQKKQILKLEDEVTLSDGRFYINTSRAINGDVSLYISIVTIFDIGAYTCSVLYSPDMMEKQVRLVVHAPPEITITRRIYVMNKESILRGSITGFYPVDIDIKWFRDGENLKNVKVTIPHRNMDGTYNVNSTVIIIPTKENNNHTFSCRVQHESLSESLQKTFQLEYTAPLEITITGRIAVINKKSILKGSIIRFYPVDIDIKWFRDGEILNNYTVSTPQSNPDGTYCVNSTVTIIPKEEDKHRTFSCRVNHESLSEPLNKYFMLEFNDKENETNIYTGKYIAIGIALLIPFTIVLYFMLQKCKKEGLLKFNTRSSQGDETRHLMEVEPHLYVEGITVPDQLLWNQQARLLCEISNPKLANLTVTWFKKEQDAEGYVPVFSAQNDHIHNLKCKKSGNRYRYTAHLDFTPSLPTEQGIKFICKVEHPSLKQPIETQTGSLYIKEFESRPQIEGITVPDVLIWNLPVKLQCKISRFYPNNLTVTWLKKEYGSQYKDPVKPSSTYQIDAVPQLEADGCYSCTASLDFTPLRKTEQNIMFICRVEHPSLTRPKEKRTGTLHVMEDQSLGKPQKRSGNMSSQMMQERLNVEIKPLSEEREDLEVKPFTKAYNEKNKTEVTDRSGHGENLRKGKIRKRHTK